MLHSILRWVEFCGRQGIALQGHRYDDTSEHYVSKGNFKALLDLCRDAGNTL